MIAKYLIALLFLAFVFYDKTNAQTESKKPGVKEIKVLLQGSWFGAEDEDAAIFSIDGDTATYIDDFSKFKYKITKDTFELQTTQPHYKELIIKLTEDSLIFKEVPSGTISRYWKS